MVASRWQLSMGWTTPPALALGHGGVQPAGVAHPPLCQAAAGARAPRGGPRRRPARAGASTCRPRLIPAGHFVCSDCLMSPESVL
jgi:hypothetical protein